MTLATPPVRPLVPHFSSGPCAKRPGWTPQNLTDAVLGRSHRSKAGKAKLKRAIDLTREVLQVPADYRIGIVPASDTGAIEMALWSLLGAAAGDDAGLGILRRRLGQRRRQGAQAQGRRRCCARRYGELPDLTAVDPASDIVFTWNGTTSGVRVPNADWIAADRAGLDDLRCDLGCVRASARLAKARCRHFLLAEGAGRRGRARHAHSLAARGRPARKLHAALAAAENLPHDQGRQADRRHLPGRDHQHAVDAVRGGLSRRARMGEVDRRTAGAARARRRQCQGHRRLGGAHGVDRFSGARSGAALQHFGLSEGRRSGGEPAFRRRPSGFRQRHRRGAREGRRCLRHRRLSRCAGGAAHLVRLDRRAKRRRGAHAVARLGLRQRQGALAKAAYACSDRHAEALALRAPGTDPR